MATTKKGNIKKVKQANRLDSVKEYYFSKKLKEIAAMKAAGNAIINLGIGSPDLPPPPAVLKTLKSASLDPLANKYQSYSGIPELRKEIAKWYRKNYNVALSAEDEILPLMGSKEGIMHISMSFLNPGDQVLIPNPGYPSYSAAAKLAGASVVDYDLNATNNWLPDFDILDGTDLSKVKLMWINYPHMPTGTAANEALFKRLIQFAKKHQILIGHDNPYSFVLNDHPLSLLSTDGAKDVAIELNSLSKSHHMAGWRVGMMLGKKEFINTVLKFKSNMDSGMYKPIQEAAIQALQTEFSWHQAQNVIYKKRQSIAFQILNTLKCKVNTNQVGLFTWGEITGDSAFKVSDEILKKTGVFITPGGIFGSQGNQFLRISLCSPESVLNEALQLIKKLKL